MNAFFPYQIPLWHSKFLYETANAFPYMLQIAKASSYTITDKNVFSYQF